MTTPTKRHIAGLELALAFITLPEDAKVVGDLLARAKAPQGWQPAAGDKVTVNRGVHPNGDKRKGEKGEIVAVEAQHNNVLVMLEHTGAGQPTPFPLDTFTKDFDLTEEEDGE